MATPYTLLSKTTILVLIHFFLLRSEAVENPSTVSSCGPSLLPLTTCAPFVQGAMPTPPQLCCDNLKQLYQQQPGCLCLFLNETNLRSLPINTTLALQLPAFCALQVDLALCSGVPPGPPPPVSLGSESNSTVPGIPSVIASPRPNIMGYGFRPSAAVKLYKEYHVVLVLLLAAIILSEWAGLGHSLSEARN